MAVHLDDRDPAMSTELTSDFAARLETSLRSADSERRRHALRGRLATWIPVMLLVGPLFAWLLTSASPGGEHVAVNALVSLTFVLDAGVHVDTAVLSSLHLEALPMVVGALLLVMTAFWLLWGDESGE
ncbi:MAG TPA: hypothetical protein DEV93_21645 [Chloroflexi bacterium]|jgi:hypothetical protein|nr:hypothetical protein [Chloroflexota bacterium]